VGNVDALQGQEADVVVVSPARTQGLGFLGDNRRLNVMLSRAAQALIVVGDLRAWLAAQGDSLLHAAAAFALHTGRAVAAPGVKLEAAAGGGGLLSKRRARARARRRC
jgi:hypothetical protein